MGTATPTPPLDRRTGRALRRRHRRGLTGPVLLIAIGVLFLLDRWVPGWQIHRTWPALLVVMGLAKLVEATEPPRPPEGPGV
jgi:hypothetical protein